MEFFKMTLYAYHFTSFHNLDSIIKNGLLCTNQKNLIGIRHHDLAHESIQGRRAGMIIDEESERTVHDYVPFYFCKRSPMLLGVLHKKNIDMPFIIYFAVDVHKIMNDVEGCFFTSASANTRNMPAVYSDPQDFDKLDWNIIKSNHYGSTEEFKQKKMAEFLVPDFLPLKYIKHISVWNEWIKDKVVATFLENNIDVPFIFEDEYHYYNDWMNDREDYPLITGPYFLLEHFNNAVKRTIDENINDGAFSSVDALLKAIDHNFNVIKELKEINYLRVSYEPHFEPVGCHTRRVVSSLELFEDFKSLDLPYQSIVKLAAYLHDIGKGPFKRWKYGIMDKADVNHSEKSLPMLERIIKEEIERISPEEIRWIFLLVTYDDLIGDIVGKGRDKEQLFQVVTSELELDMMFSLSKADMFSINPQWLIDHREALLQLREDTLEYLQSCN